MEIPMPVMLEEGESLGNEISNDPLVTSGKVKKSKKKISEQKKSRSLEEPSVPETPKTVKNSPLTRSKTYDLTTTKNLDNESGLERRRSSSSNLPKHNITFHRVFKEVPEDEDLVDSFSCAWQKEVLYQGRLYISPNYVSFYCTMLRKEIKVLITIIDIAVLKKANTALLVPNALCIKTVEGEKYLFGSLRNREIAYQVLWALCPHLQDGSPNNSPLSSPADTSSEQCKKTLNSSQSDLEHELPDEDPSFSFPDTPDGGGSVHSRVKIEDDVKKSSPPTRNKGECSNPKATSSASWQNLSSINILLIIYLMLVVVLLLSSGYIGLRIVELEQQLTLMGAWPELNLQSSAFGEPADLPKKVKFWSFPMTIQTQRRKKESEDGAPKVGLPQEARRRHGRCTKWWTSTPTWATKKKKKNKEKTTNPDPTTRSRNNAQHSESRKIHAAKSAASSLSDINYFLGIDL